MPDSIPAPVVDPALSANEALRGRPGAVGAPNASGVDTCCGGGASLAATDGGRA
jgi:hypothetical protein